MGNAQNRSISSSRTIPNDRDFHFYCNFSEFNDPIRSIVAQSQSTLESIGSSHIWNCPIMFPNQTDIDHSYDWLGNVNDEALESFDMSLDDFNKSRGKEKVDGKNENGFQLTSINGDQTDLHRWRPNKPPYGGLE
ncbi:hypothetical protein Q3G72_008448 [Acer saccharum]|nr:hypothetical protein Q3G72_008448 [Acer saccharum]